MADVRNSEIFKTKSTLRFKNLQNLKVELHAHAMNSVQAQVALRFNIQ